MGPQHPGVGWFHDSPCHHSWLARSLGFFRSSLAQGVGDGRSFMEEQLGQCGVMETAEDSVRRLGPQPPVLCGRGRTP